MPLRRGNVYTEAGTNHVKSREGRAWWRVQQEQKPWGSKEVGLFKELQAGLWALSVVSRGTVVVRVLGHVTGAINPPATMLSPCPCHHPLLVSFSYGSVANYHKLGGLKHTFILTLQSIPFSS